MYMNGFTLSTEWGISMRVEPIQWEAQQSGPPGKLHQKSTTIPKWRHPNTPGIPQNNIGDGRRNESCLAWVIQFAPHHTGDGSIQSVFLQNACDCTSVKIWKFMEAVESYRDLPQHSTKLQSISMEQSPQPRSTNNHIEYAQKHSASS